LSSLGLARDAGSSVRDQSRYNPLRAILPVGRDFVPRPNLVSLLSFDIVSHLILQWLKGGDVCPHPLYCLNGFPDYAPVRNAATGNCRAPRTALPRCERVAEGVAF